MVSRSKKISLRAHLRALLKQHPDWTNKQYAEFLGQKQSTIRGARAAMHRTGWLPTKEPKQVAAKKTSERKHSKAKPIIYRQELDRRTLTSRTVGYLKLL